MGEPNTSKFIHGFLAGVAGWLITSIAMGIILAGLNSSGRGLWASFIERPLEWLGSGAIISVFIWLPVALIAGNMSRKRGLKAALMFVVAAFFISLLVMGGCFGLF